MVVCPTLLVTNYRLQHDLLFAIRRHVLGNKLAAIFARDPEMSVGEQIFVEPKNEVLSQLIRAIWTQGQRVRIRAYFQPYEQRIAAVTTGVPSFRNQVNKNSGATSHSQLVGAQTLNIIAVDWAKGAAKRSAYQARLDTRTISRLAIDGSLAQLIDHASSLDLPALIGIDAAIGFPISSWKKLTNNSDNQSGHFIDCLLNGPLPSRFFDPVTKPEEWSPERPFIRPPKGKWSLGAFVEASDGGLYRKIDLTLNGNSIFVMSGLPGSVGSGTRALWQELVALGRRSSFSVWPFHGTLDTLLKDGKPVIAEIYPKACYGIAVAESLPTPLIKLAKTNESARKDTLARLRDSHWVERERIIIEDIESANENEDDFDALVSVAAMMRIFLENAPIESPKAIEAKIEGGVLGAASLTTPTRRVLRTLSAKPVNQKTTSSCASRKYPCPIPGCTHMFHNSRGGWDAHVASFPRHPHWHPDTHDPAQRKQLFKGEFPSWFRN